MKCQYEYQTDLNYDPNLFEKMFKRLFLCPPKGLIVGWAGVSPWTSGRIDISRLYSYLIPL